MTLRPRNGFSPQRRHERALLAALVASCCFLGTPCHGNARETDESASGAAPNEARQRFDRGLGLYEAGDYWGALAEFQRAHELSGHPIVLYNVALVHAKLGEAVHCIEAIEALRARGFAELGPERQARLERVYAEQSARVGTVELSANVPDAVLQVDNVDVSRAAARRLRLSAGRHLVSAFAPNHAPKSVAISVVGGDHRVVALELVPLAASLGRLRISSAVPDVEVRIGTEVVAELPLAGELMLTPGAHSLEFSRPGYATLVRRVDVAPGGSATLDVVLTPTVDGVRAGGQLQLAISEPNAIVEIDGIPHANPDGGIRLPLGRHAVRVQRAGFFDVKRSVEVAAGVTSVEVRLLPTPEYWAEYVGSARRTRTLAYVTGGAGLVAIAASGGYLLWNQGQKNDAERAFQDYERIVAAEPSGTCDDTCAKKLNLLADDLDRKRKRDVYGWVGVGVGAAALGAGVLFYALGDDPDRYDPRPVSDVFGGLSIQLGASSLGLHGRF